MSSSNLCYILCAFLIFVSQTKAGQYWGNHCGRESRDRNRPIIDAFDAVCYQHDRCQESSTPDWLCSVQVSMGMMQASQQTGQPVPMQILQGFGAEHGMGKRRRRRFTSAKWLK